MLVSNYSYIQVMACDTKMSYWLLRGFCFFLSLDRSCLVFPPFKTVSPYRTFNFTFSKKCDYYFKLKDSRKLFKKDLDEF